MKNAPQVLHRTKQRIPRIVNNDIDAPLGGNARDGRGRARVRHVQREPGPAAGGDLGVLRGGRGGVARGGEDGVAGGEGGEGELEAEARGGACDEECVWHFLLSVFLYFFRLLRG